VREALDQTDRLVTVVDDLLANARSERASGASEITLVDELAEIEVEWGPMLQEQGRTLSVRCPRDIQVRATPGRLREAIAVLVDNSLRHGDGAVGITVRTPTRGPGSMVVLEVADEGTGIPEALVAHVFDRGISTASSTGIGLGLARAFVEADGGRLELRRAAPPVFAIFLAVGRDGQTQDAQAGRADGDAGQRTGRPADSAAESAPASAARPGFGPGESADPSPDGVPVTPSAGKR